MTADELAGLRPGDRVYRVSWAHDDWLVSSMTVVARPSYSRADQTWFRDDVIGDLVALRPDAAADWHRTEADAHLAALAAQEAALSRLREAARRAGVATANGSQLGEPAPGADPSAPDRVGHLEQALAPFVGVVPDHLPDDAEWGGVKVRNWRWAERMMDPREGRANG